MAPPPSQAGKFKPRKPVKKVRAAGAVITPGAAAAAVRPSEVPSSADAARKGGPNQQKPPRRTFQTPQGSVFFTGNQATAAKKGRTGRSASSLRAKRDGDGAGGTGGEEEVVVGQLDVAIGSSAALLAKQQQERARQESAEAAADDYYAEDSKPSSSSRRGNNNAAGNAAALDYIMYYSDSDDDKESWPTGILQPTQLPIPPPPTSNGTTASTTATDKLNVAAVGVVDSSQQNQQQQQHSAPAFPISDAHLEQSQWYLFQLPTRLPPLKQDDDKVAVKSDEAMATSAATLDVPEVTTSPILAGSFDNAMATAKPGHLGKIQVYKSGKAVLVMDGPEGKIRMNLTEGLSCGFFQQAVVINTDDGSYTPMGDVQKTIVVTPDIDHP